MMKTHFPEDKQAVVSKMLDALTHIKGIEAITLGGSFARGYATPDSDIDLGIYYFEKSPPLIDELRELAKQFSDSSSPIVTNFYEWGHWVNGGAWLNTQAGKIDWLYRNLDQVSKVIEDAKQGRFSWDFRQQPPYGFFSVMYLADLQQNIVLYDPNETFARLKETTHLYPEALRHAIIQEHLWSVEFSYFGAQKLAKRGYIYGTVGCMTRIAAELTQVLFALNRLCFGTERGALDIIETFPLKPTNYSSRMNDILSSPGQGEVLLLSLKKLHELIQEAIRLSYPVYTPKYQMS
jgi:predicted nucleotidyltransferase